MRRCRYSSATTGKLSAPNTISPPMMPSTMGSLWKPERLVDSGKMVKPALLKAEMEWNRLCQAASPTGYLKTSRANSSPNPITWSAMAKMTT